MVENSRQASHENSTHEHKILKTNKDSVFSSKMIDIRIQSIWILFTGIYVLVGNYINNHCCIMYIQWVSSALLTVAGALVLLIISHSVIEDDRPASRRTLLVALTACLFLIQKSYDTYHDFTGAMFASIFATIIFIVAWMDDELTFYDIIKSKIIYCLNSTVVFSSFFLIIAIMDDYVLTYINLPLNYMPISAHVSGICVGLLVSWVMYPRIAESCNIINERYIASYSFQQTIILLICSIYIVYNTSAASLSGNIIFDINEIVFASAYVIAMTSLSIICIYTLMPNLMSISITLSIFIIFIYTMALSLGLAKLQIALGITGEVSISVYILSMYLYIMPAFGIVLSSICSTFCIKLLYKLLYQKIENKGADGSEKI